MSVTQDVKLKAENHAIPTRAWGGLAPYLAEGIGTFGLVFAGCGAIVIDTLSHGQITHVGVGLVFGLIIRS
jgi:glycerol uptake facilitator-like aquaporin